MMKTNYKKSFLGSILAFVLGTSCCWLTSLAVWLGGATILTILSKFVNEYRILILGIAFLFSVMGVYQFLKHKKGKGVAFLFIISLSLLCSTSAFSQTINKVIGKWKTDDNRAIIEIFAHNGQFFGKIVWLQIETDKKGYPRKDIANPDITKRSADVLGLTIMNNFVIQNNTFINGTIYDPDSGSSYDCKLWLDNDNNLKVRDYCGIFYKTFTWSRVK